MGSYAPPFISASGLTVPTYTQILNLLLQNFQAIYGPGVYLGVDSADYQMLSIFALALSDAYSAIQLDYNNRAANFAVGAALDSLVKLNGLVRKSATYSTCPVVITGTPNTVITGGLVRDTVPGQGALWALPSPLTIPSGGTLNTVVTCQTIGALNALPGQLTIIATPTAGWTNVTNAVAASLGQPVETDSQLRTRQALSTELPSITMLAGTIAAIAAVAGVTRYNVVENPTNAVDANGNPPHSITAVVEGGAALDIATAIYNNRGIGCFTNGTTTVNVTDPNTGIVMAVSFDLPTYKTIYVTANVHPLAGYTSATGAAIQTAIQNYLNSLQIGELVTLSALYAAAMAVTPSLQVPLFSIRALFLGTAPGPTGTADITMSFNQVAAPGTIQINTV